MKIERISFDNLNSLGGHFDIDFTHPSLADGGIFVITGPTGSGKTTLLDAITYALYGQTVRQGKLTAASNEIMTHGSRFCRAEVVVERAGVRYLFSTEQRRKKTRSAKADPFTTTERRASRLEADGTATLLAAEVGGVRQVAEGLMKYENFCRCMMLAQGDFARFLKAGAAERSEALATITGTGIYQRIGEKVQERVAELRNALASVALLPVKDAAQRAEAEARSLAQEAVCQQHQASLDALENKLRWQQELAQAEATRRAREAEHEQAQAALQQFTLEGHPARLRAAEAALSLRPNEVARHAAEQALATTRAQLEREEGWLEAHPGTGMQEAADKATADLTERQPEIEEQLRFLTNQVQPLEEAIGKAEVQAHAASRFAALRQREALAATAACQRETDTATRARAAEQKAAAALSALPSLTEAERQHEAAQQRAALAYKIQSASGKLAELYREFCEGHLSCCPCCGSPTPHKHPQHDAGELARAQQEAQHLSATLSQLKRQRETAQTTLATATATHSAARRAAELAAAEAENKAALQRDAARAEQEARQALTPLRAEFARRWQGGSVREAKQALRTELASLQTAHTRSREALHAFICEREAHKALAEAARAQLSGREATASKAAADFLSALKGSGFADEEAYRAALLPAEETEHLRHEETRRYQQLARAEGALRQASTQVEALQQQQATPAPPEALQEQKRALLALLHEQKELLTATLAELRQDDDAQRANAQKEAQLANIRAQLAPWQQLYEILGSSKDGFKKYAQRITFNLLLRQANQQLRLLSERYTLMQDEEKELGLRVIDRYQDDERGRACSNLSGGESFLVSLALALALSRMTGETRIDSLFMDEGFGTLDEQSLEQVLDCLQRLRAGGKLIGIISHVSALKERIPAHLELIPLGATGLSTIAAHEAVVATPRAENNRAEKGVLTLPHT